MLDYEREHWRYASDEHQVVERFLEDWAIRWFPRPATHGWTTSVATTVGAADFADGSSR